MTPITNTAVTSSETARPGYDSKKSAVLVLLSAVLALVLKIFCASTTVGETDVSLFFHYGKRIHEVGLDDLYRSSVLFNHTPVVGSFSCLAYELSAWLNPPDSPNAYRFFPLILRLPVILADFLTILVVIRLCKKIARQPPAWALVLFALSPVSFMISGYHGNVDSVMTLFMVIAAYFCVRENPLACGLYLGLACNIKIIPLLFTPVFFFFWLPRGLKPVFQYTAACILTCLAGWSAALIGSPIQFVKQVLGYSSYWGEWGISYWLNITHCNLFHCPAFFVLNPVQQTIVTCLKAVVILAVMFISWRRRHQDVDGFIATLALAWVIFFVFAPSACVQYLLWPAPFLLLYSARWYAMLTAASSLCLFVFYQVISGGLPWMYGDSTDATSVLTRPWTNWPWAVMIACLIGSWKKLSEPARCANKA